MSKRDQNSQANTGRKAIRVLFVPWTKAEGSDWYEHSETWRKVEETRGTKGFFSILGYTGGPLLGFNYVKPDDVIYVVGHGVKGFDEIWPYQAAGDRGLSSSALVERLITSGLRTDWTGDLKLYACHSSSTDLGPSFLSRVSEHLLAKQFHCRIWGYGASISCFPIHTSDQNGVIAVVSIGNKTAVLKDAPAGRPSNNREQYR